MKAAVDCILVGDEQDAAEVAIHAMDGRRHAAWGARPYCAAAASPAAGVVKDRRRRVPRRRGARKGQTKCGAESALVSCIEIGEPQDNGGVVCVV